MTGRVLRLRRDGTATLGATVPLAGEPFYNTDTFDMGIGNGAALADSTSILFSKQNHAHNSTIITYTGAGTLHSTTAAAAIAALAGRLPQIISRITTTPPVAPEVGDNYIVPTGSSGDWAAHATEIATADSLTPTWTYTVPVAGQYVVNDEDQALWRYSGSAWQAAGLTLYLRGEITPTGLTGNVNDYAPPGISLAIVLRLSSDASRTITGVTAGTAGRVLKLLNVGANNILLTDASGSSTAANRFSFGASITLKPGESVVIWYDATQSRWALLARAYVVITEIPTSIAYSGAISPAQLTAQTDNWNPIGLADAATIYIDVSTALSITGLQGGRAGREVTLFNTVAQNATLPNQSGSSSAANRFTQSADIILGQYQSATYRWKDSTSAWTLRSSTAGAQVADGAVGPAGLSSDALGLRRKIYAAPADALAFNGLTINADHTVSQENGDTAVTSIGSAGGVNTYITDQYSIRAKGTLRVSGARVTSISLPGYKYALRCTITTTQSSLGAGDLLAIETPIEGLRVIKLGYGAAGANPLSRGVWLRSSASGTFGVYLTNSARDRSHVKTIALVANTWKWCNFENTAGAGQTAFPGDTSGTWLTDTGVGLRLGVTLAAGTNLEGTGDTWTGSEIISVSGNTNLAATASATFDITGDFPVPGLELPPSANAPFLMRPYERDALRYFWQVPITGSNQPLVNGQATAAGTAIFGTDYPEMMRTGPSLAISAAAHFGALTASGGAVNAGTGLALSAGLTAIAVLSMSGSSGLVAGDATTLYTANAAAKMAFNARMT